MEESPKTWCYDFAVQPSGFSPVVHFRYVRSARPTFVVYNTVLSSLLFLKYHSDGNVFVLLLVRVRTFTSSGLPFVWFQNKYLIL